MLRLASCFGLFWLMSLAAAIDSATTPTSASATSSVIRPQALIRTSMGDIRVELFSDQCPETVANFLGLAHGTKVWQRPDRSSATTPFYDGLTFHRVIPGFMIQGGCPNGNGTGGPGFQFADEINPKDLGLDAQFLQPGAQGPEVHPWVRNPPAVQAFQQGFVLPELTKRGLGPESKQQDLQEALTAILPGLMKVTLRDVFTKQGYVYSDTLPPSSAPVRGSLCMANSGPNTNGSQFFIDVVNTEHLRGKHTVFGMVIEGQSVADAITNVQTDANARPVTPVTILSIRRIGE